MPLTAGTHVGPYRIEPAVRPLIALLVLLAHASADGRQPHSLQSTARAPAPSDPWTLQLSTLFGGDGIDTLTGVATTPQGLVVAVGWTTSTDFPAVRTSGPRGSDAFVSLIDPRAGVFLWTVLIGGSKGDSASAVAVDADGSIYLTGSTTSEDFPTTPDAVSRVLKAGTCATSPSSGHPCTDAFIVRLDRDGRLLYGSFFGGRDDERPTAIAVVQPGIIQVAGTTRSTDLPVYRALKPTSSHQSAFTLRLDMARAELLYATYLAGRLGISGDEATSVAIGPDGSAYVGGYGDSSELEGAVTFGTKSRFDFTGFVARIAPDGSRLLYHVWIGGTGGFTLVALNGITVDARGAAYLVGYTAGTFPVPATVIGSLGTGTARKTFLARLSPDGTAIELATSIGGISDPRAVAVGPLGVINVAGTTSLTTLPLVQPLQPSLASGTLFRSADEGATWTHAGIPGSPKVWDVTRAAGSSVMYAATGAGVFKSVDEGRSWQAPKGPSGLERIRIAAAPSNPDVAYIANSVNVFRTIDGGATWAAVARTAGVVHRMIVHPLDHRKVWAATSAGLETSDDGGTTWRSGLGGGAATDVVFVPGRPGTLYADVQGVLWKSVSDGTSWTRIGIPVTGRLAIDPTAPDTIYVAGRHKSTDGGTTWTAIGSGLPEGTVRQLVVDPSSPQTLFGEVLTGVFSSPNPYRSTDGGLSWQALLPRLNVDTETRTVYFDPENPRRVWLLQEGNSVSADGFLLTLDSTGTQLLRSTYLGGIGTDAIASLAATEDGTLIVAGSTRGVGFPTAAPFMQPEAVTFSCPFLSIFGSGDSDGDGMPDGWEASFGLLPGANDANGDPDGDGWTNRDEYQQGTHPNGRFNRYFAEGASTGFFTTQLALLNPGDATAHVLRRLLKADRTFGRQALTIAPHTRRTVDAREVAGVDGTAFSTVVESDLMIVADRAMSWDERGYGSHAETGTAAPGTTWFLAEGATHSGFNLFYLLQNPGGTAASVTVTYLLPAGAPVTRTYVVGARSRFNIWLNAEGRTIPALASSDVSARIVSDRPILVERSMYLDTGGDVFGAGHAAAAVAAPALSWFLAEGATGSYFDTFVLVANPNEAPSRVEATFMLPDGTVVQRSYTIEGRSRFTIWVDGVDAKLANTAVSTIIKVINDVPVIVERAMWWPGPTAATWHEGHNSAGTLQVGTMWAMADGEQGGSRNAATYVLVANVSAAAATLRATLFFEDGTSLSRSFTVPANSRFNIDIGAHFPAAYGRRFGTVVESLGAAPADLVVERAMYSDARGVAWAGGTHATATKLR